MSQRRFVETTLVLAMAVLCCCRPHTKTTVSKADEQDDLADTFSCRELKKSLELAEETEKQSLASFNAEWGEVSDDLRVRITHGRVSFSYENTGRMQLDITVEIENTSSETRELPMRCPCKGPPALGTNAHREDEWTLLWTNMTPPEVPQFLQVAASTSTSLSWSEQSPIGLSLEATAFRACVGVPELPHEGGSHCALASSTFTIPRSVLEHVKKELGEFEVKRLVHDLQCANIPDIRERAAGSLGGHDHISDDAIDALIEAVMNDRIPMVRRRAATALGATGLPRAEAAIQPLIDVSRSDRYEVTEWTIYALARGFKTRRAIPVCMEWLASKDKRLRAHGAWAIGWIEPPYEEAIPALVDLFENDPVENVRRQACWALGKLGKKARAELKRLLKSDDPYVREFAGYALDDK